MMISAKRLAWLIAALGLMSGRAQAGLVNYTETVTGSGTFGGATYTNQLVTISLTANTSGITMPSANTYYTPSGLATITVGSTSGTILVNGFDYQPSGVFGFTFQNGNISTDILDVTNAALTSYALGGPIGPLTGTAAINPNATFTTSAGSFNITSYSGQVSFVATIPEPSSLALCGIAGAIALGCRQARSRRTSP